MTVLDCIKKLEVPANEEYIEKCGSFLSKQNISEDILAKKVKIAEAHSNKHMRKQLKCRMTSSQIQEICDTLLIKLIKIVEVKNIDESILLKMYEEWREDKGCVPSSVFSWTNFKLENQMHILAIICFLKNNFDENKFNIIFCRTLLKFIRALLLEQIASPVLSNQEYIKSKNFKNQLKALCVTVFLQRSNLIEFETNVPNVMLELVRIVKLKDVSFICSILIQMLPEKAKSFLKKADIHLYKSKSDLIKGEENSVISIVFTKTQLSVNISEEIKNKEELLPTRIKGEKWIEHLQSLFLTSKQISLNKNIQKFPIAENEVEEYAKNMNELASHEEDESEIEEMSNEGRVFTIEEVLKNFS